MPSSVTLGLGSGFHRKMGTVLLTQNPQSLPSDVARKISPGQAPCPEERSDEEWLQCVLVLVYVMYFLAM